MCRRGEARRERTKLNGRAMKIRPAACFGWIPGVMFSLEISAFREDLALRHTLHPKTHALGRKRIQQHPLPLQHLSHSQQQSPQQSSQQQSQQPSISSVSGL